MYILLQSIAQDESIVGIVFLPVPGSVFQVNFKVKRSNWDGTGDEHDEEAKKEDEEVSNRFVIVVSCDGATRRVVCYRFALGLTLDLHATARHKEKKKQCK